MTRAQLEAQLSSFEQQKAAAAAKLNQCLGAIAATEAILAAMDEPAPAQANGHADTLNPPS